MMTSLSGSLPYLASGKSLFQAGRTDLRAGDRRSIRLRVIWENPSECHIIEETTRLYAFAAIMFAFIEFKKVNKTHIELIEDHKNRVFELLVNQISVLKCRYKTTDTNSITQFTTIRDTIIDNPTVNMVSQQKAQELQHT